MMYDAYTSKSLNESVIRAVSMTPKIDPGLGMRLLEGNVGYGLWRVGWTGGETQFSPKAREAFGLPDDTNPVSVNSWVACFAKEDQPTLLDLIEGAHANKCGFRCALRVGGGDKPLRLIEIFSDVEIDSHDRPRAMFGTVRDVTAEAQADFLAERRNILLRSLLRYLPAAVAVLDDRKRYIAASHYWVEGMGLKGPRDIVGKPLAELPPFATGDIESKIDRALIGQIVYGDSALLYRERGDDVDRRYIITPWQSPDNQSRGAMVAINTARTASLKDSHPFADEFLTRRKSRFG